MNNTIDDLIGDVPVSEQLAAALERMAPKDHTHEYATKAEVEDLKQKIEALMDLIGDTPVAEQIARALTK
jgi:hypothetical protein